MSETGESFGEGAFAALIISIACVVGIVSVVIISWPSHSLYATPGVAANRQGAGVFIPRSWSTPCREDPHRH